MAKKIRITVTQDDIDKGVRRSANRCPISRAVDRKFDLNQCDSTVGTSILHYPYNGKYISFYMSQKGRNFVKNFDSNKPVKPFTFYAIEI